MKAIERKLRTDQEGGALPDASVEDPSPQIVRLAARLIRLQSHFRPRPDALGEPGKILEFLADPLAEQSAETAIRHSGIELLQGVATALNTAIVDAVERDAFFYEYQPVVSTANGALEGYEALVRWRRGDRAVSPDYFLPIAEETEAIVQMQQRLLDDVAAAYVQLAAPVSIGINWSPTQLSRVGAVSAFIDRVRELHIDPRRILIEVTERAVTVDPELAQANIARLKEQGFRIALDDFGRGYCGFAYLSRLPIDVIKIDSSLVDGLGQSARCAIILDGIVDIAHRLGYHVVAEGVETQEQFNVLRRSGCDSAQGKFIGYPSRHLLPNSGPGMPIT
jgi:EAL domain-containing protein (putative c-di-GMP-specific phosphodiesterase class I)